MNTSGITALRMNALMTSLLIGLAITMPLICSYDPMLTRPTCLTLSHCAHMTYCLPDPHVFNAQMTFHNYATYMLI